MAVEHDTPRPTSQRPDPPAARPLRRAGRIGDTAGPASCSCTAIPLFSPAGEIIVLRVSGEVDLATIDLLRAALDALLDQRPYHLVVDLAALSFCDGQGLDELVTAACTAARNGTGYAISAPSAQADRLWSTLWPAAEVPIRYPNAATAVLAAVADQARIHIPARLAVADSPDVGRPVAAADGTRRPTATSMR